MPFGHIWSLSVEEHSYILLSFIAIIHRYGIFSAKKLVGIFSVLFSIAGFYYWSQYSGRELDFRKWIHTEVSAYGIFVSAFLLLFLANRKIPTLNIMVYPVLLGFSVLLNWWSIPNPLKTFFGVAFFALLINLLCSAPPLINRLDSWGCIPFQFICGNSLFILQPDLI
jgi:peptidoglycan/LPS O-acetylase OafA/YrhL